MRTCLDLFSGIGGFSLAAEWAGYRTVQFVEIDPWCRRVLAKNFPGASIHDDIRTFSGTALAGTVDLLTGGFPCQPVSVAGQRRGAADDRWLWPEMARVVAEVRPRVVVAENVPGIVRMGLDQVLSDLDGLGYACGTLVVPAAGVGAPHLRYRVWIVACDVADAGREGCPAGGVRGGVAAAGTVLDVGVADGGPGGIAWDAADAERAERREDATGGQRIANGADGGRQEAAGWVGGCGQNDAADAAAPGPPNGRAGQAPGTEPARGVEPERPGGDADDADRRRHGAPDATLRARRNAPLDPGWWEAQPGVRGVVDGLPAGVDPTVVGRLPDRVNRLKGLGNAIVPRVAYEIIMAMDGDDR